ncbi:Fc.00g026870.m01.CDS01 [Cosmosporella sp. VM-42]
MKFTIALALSYSCALTAASPQPELQWDPNTISTCVEWFNNGSSDTCESIRSMFGISPEDFHKWNPSVGTDCKPWRYQSYCILTKERLSSLTSTTTTTKAKTTTTSSSTHAPSPTSWKALGCYTDDDAKYPVLEKQVSSADSALQIKSCEDKCWKASNSTVLYAGVKAGNQCWCGSFVGGQTSNKQTECNTPCSGNSKEICGGKGRINVFEPVTTTTRPKTTATSSKTTTATTKAVTTSKQSSGAAKNHVLF